ncbi:MAG: hypothetical protein A3C02_04275 [Candidatus Andersenbacteria bacterium RIFCSPHIGHO2_02_FULL_45_11]|uniref:Transcriptional repressor n=1 Tax=Candidatus Andersenbacteria bacterium RIFCSPHIGHO2_12_FULL_45_11 TaxID=1797281 RepID=A0A1G1X0E2_9BACT|nr:MAG: hypothetical protein A3C02_04275 [Candidatus Andersenbacteria bacterium RIFCSPHIGHO2_02_FULL_45_11]OGY33433.1 MAG: hypothetical protein A3D99_04805 [Candidatus Andersenbacteria bacterium RIFCSPHIGHO2_12_FULL_45_11]
MQLDFTAQLREKRTRVTPSRLAVLSLLEKEKRPLSVEKIITAIGEDAIDYVTVYRTVTLLKELGLIRQIDFHHGHAHYELASLGDHHHVVCVKCDKVAEVARCNAKRMEQEILKESGFSTITDHSLEFFGICRNCSI